MDLPNGAIPRGVGALLTLGAIAIAAFLGMFFSAQAGLLAIAAAWVAVGAWVFPEASFLLLLFFAPLLPILKATDVLSLITPLKDVVIVTLFLRAVALPVLKKRDPYRENTLLVPTFAFIVWTIVGTLRADLPVLGILRLRDLLLYVPLLWVARALMRENADFRRFLRVLLGSLTLTLLLVFLQAVVFPDGMVQRYDPARSVWIPRASGPLAHPNFLASYILCTLPLVAALALVRGVRPRLRIVGVALSFSALLALGFTYSRGGWLALVAALTALGFLVFSRKPRAAVGFLTLVAVCGSILTFSVPRVRTLFVSILDPTYASNADRLGILVDVVSTATPASAIVGRGLGDSVTATLRTVRISLANITAADVQEVRRAKAQTFVDNAVLKTWLEMGVVGIVVFLWIAARAFLLARAACLTDSLPERRAFGVAVGAMVMGLLVLALFLDVPEMFPVPLFFWTFLGVLEALPYLREEPVPTGAA